MQSHLTCHRLVTRMWQGVRVRGLARRPSSFSKRMAMLTRRSFLNGVGMSALSAGMAATVWGTGLSFLAGGSALASTRPDQRDPTASDDSTQGISSAAYGLTRRLVAFGRRQTSAPAWQLGRIKSFRRHILAIPDPGLTP
jgi:hypothetical protein